MSMDRETRLRYIEETAFGISDALHRDADSGREADPARLRDDIGWLMRSVAWLARLAAEDGDA